MGACFKIYRKYWAKEVPEGATHHPRGWRHALPPGRAPCLVGPLAALWCPSSAIWGLPLRKKFISDLTGWNSAATRRNLGGTNLGLRRSCFVGETSLRRGNHHHRHHQRSSHREGVNLHQHLHQHHLISNPNSSLVSNLCLKTSDWYLWVASSVDYSL